MTPLTAPAPPATSAPPRDVLLIGAMKAGTTALFDHLAGHPAVAASRVKEPHHYADDLRDVFSAAPVAEAEALATLRADPEARLHQAAVASREGYRWLFPQRPGVAVRLEASPSSLPSAVAAARVADLAERPLAVAVLRDPFLRLVSHFEMNVSLGIEDRTLAAAVAAELADGAPARTGDRVGMVRLSLYADDVRRWRSALGREAVVTVLHERLVADPGAVVAEICARAGLAPLDAEIERRNATPTVRSARLNGLLVRLGVRSLAARLLPAALVDAVRPVYFRARDLSAYADAFRLVAPLFEADRLALEAETGLDLSLWTSP